MAEAIQEVALPMAHSEGSFVRWQGIAVNQLGFANNLFLTFATASLGFTLTLVTDEAVTSSCWARSFLVGAGFSSILFHRTGLLVRVEPTHGL
jgi:hypothetical protein